MPGMLEHNILKLMANRNEESLPINNFVVFKKNYDKNVDPSNHVLRKSSCQSNRKKQLTPASISIQAYR